MNILITGVAGFIGAAISKALLEQGHAVYGIDNLNDYYNPQLKIDRLSMLNAYEKFTFEKIDIIDKLLIDNLFKNNSFDKVAHMAAQAGVRYSISNPDAYIQSNIVGFMNILEGCRNYRIKHLVFASSSSVYGANRKMPFSVHDNVDHPLSLYAASKKANELMAHTYSHLYHIPTTGLRFFTVYGPWGRPDMALFSFTKKILAGEAIQVFNYGKHSRDFTYIDDIVEGVIKVIDSPATPNPNWSGEKPDPSSSSAPYRIYNIGNHQPVLLTDFISTLENELGIEAKKELVEMAPGDVLDTYADISDLQRDFDFKPTTNIKEGIKNFVSWYKSYY